MKELVQPNVMRDSEGEVILCGEVSKTRGHFRCGFLKRNLRGSLGPIKAPDCPISDLRSATCEFLQPFHEKIAKMY
jgi:hypothetical protein